MATIFLNTSSKGHYLAAVSTQDHLITALRGSAPSLQRPPPLPGKIDAVLLLKTGGMEKSSHKTGRNGGGTRVRLVELPTQRFSSLIDLDNVLIGDIFISQSKEINYSLMVQFRN